MAENEKKFTGIELDSPIWTERAKAAGPITQGSYYEQFQEKLEKGEVRELSPLFGKYQDEFLERLNNIGNDPAALIAETESLYSRLAELANKEEWRGDEANWTIAWAAAELENRLEKTVENALALAASKCHEVQLESFRLAPHLQAGGVARLLAFWDKNYRSLTDQGTDSFYENSINWHSDTYAFPHQPLYVNGVFRLAGEVTAAKSTSENREKFEELYLNLLKDHIANEYLGIEKVHELDWPSFLDLLKKSPRGRREPFRMDIYGRDRDWQEYLAEEQKKEFEKDYGEEEAGAMEAKDEIFPYSPLRANDDDAWAHEMVQEDFEEPLFPINTAFEHLQKFGGRKSSELLLAWLRFNPDANASLVGETLSKTSPNLAANELLPLLNNSDKAVAKAAARALYRIELGRIGISEQGVKYLEKIYDLGEHNNPDYFVQRLTASGDIGIFNETRELTRYFNLGDLTSKEEVIKAQVLSFVYETLFTPKADETTTDRAEREVILEEFQKNHFRFYGDEFFNQTNLRFNNLSFKEQGLFLHFIEASGEEKKERTMDATRKFGREWLYSFLALDWGSEYGERLLAIAERYPPDLARVFFHEYSRVNFAAQDLGKEIGQVFGEAKHEFVTQFQEALTRRLKDIINVAYQLASEGKAVADFNGREVASEDLAQPVEALRDAGKMVELVKQFLSEEGAKSGRFKFLPPVMEEKVVAGTPTGISNEQGLWQCFRFAVEPIAGISKNHSHFMVQLRKYGAPVYAPPGGTTKSMHNSKIEFDGEARINFVWIPEPVDAENVSLLVDNPERQAAISFRLDREGKVRDKEGNPIKEKNDPTRLAGELSLEMGGVRATEQPAHNHNTRLGETIAIGQYFASRHDKFEAGKLPQYYHNRASFSAKYGRADFFANLAEKMARSIAARYAPAETKPEPPR